MNLLRTSSACFLWKWKELLVINFLMLTCTVDRLHSEASLFTTHSAIKEQQAMQSVFMVRRSLTTAKT